MQTDKKTRYIKILIVLLFFLVVSWMIAPQFFEIPPPPHVGPYEISLDRFAANVKNEDEARRYVSIEFSLILTDKKYEYYFDLFSESNPRGKLNKIKSEIIQILVDKELDFYSRGKQTLMELADEVKNRLNELIKVEGELVVTDVLIPNFLIQ